MYKNICFTGACLMLCSIIITYLGRETLEEQLAYKMSKSENFKAIMDYGKEIAGNVEVMPDSNKNKLRALKSRMGFLLKNNKNLSHFEVKDSMMMIINFVKKESFFDSSFYKEGALMIPVFKKFDAEFPEYTKMPKDERSIVFKKAAAIFLKNSEYKN